MDEEVEAPLWVEEFNGPSYPPLSGTKRKVRSKKMEFVGWGSKSLIEFLQSIGKDATQHISRHDVTGIVNRYVNENSLVHPVKKKRINCDERLHALFGRKSIARNKIHHMLEPHYAENLDKSDDDELLYSSEEDNIFPSYEQQKGLSLERKSTLSKKRSLEPSKSCFASIVPDNLKLLYLKRSLVQELLNYPETFESKITGSYVRIKSDPKDYFQKNSHCLLQVTGIKKVPGANDTSTEILLQVSNFSKDIHISFLSDDNFSEEECADLHQRIKDGLLRRPTVVELEEKAQLLHEDITKHWLIGELALLQKLIDRANEKGWRRELFEYLERRQLLQTPAEQSRLLNEVPKIIAEELEQEASPISDGINQGNNGSRAPVLKETSEFRICDITANGTSSCLVSHNKELAGTEAALLKPNQPTELGMKAALPKSNQQTELASLLDFSVGKQQNLPTDIRNDSSVVMQPVQTEEAKKAEPEVINLSDDEEDENPIVEMEPGSLEWYYVDPQGDIQGPFSMTLLKRWSDADFFPQDFKVWKTGQSQEEAVLLLDILQWVFPN